ncbi:Hybrid signal transduction protein dokA [Paraphaeosphaeria minitans]|uniref:histidine kinase n=1 Tax=Paraphaeosphaeria minitans TaxID=565426 RepID=A0A9P6G9E1_9PLEO|nr:Hybrid signal transduction protein dokA [Paraphaeosphaeria minitans]
MLYTEAARQRHLQRYYQPWVDAAQDLAEDSEGEDKSLVYRGYRPNASFDKSLTAFAQLIVLRLNVKRAMVSLIDSTRQYILAEATRSLSLSNHSTDSGDDLWLGHAIIARNEAVCHHTFGCKYTAVESNAETYTTNALVIPDCRLDVRVADKDYVTSEPGVRFYAGVPITTRNGYRIGVFAVSDDKPRHALSAAEVKAMEDISEAVMEHLELAKESDDRSKGERMVRGLTTFIERSSTEDSRGSTSTRQTTLEKQTQNARLEVIADEQPSNAAASAVKELQCHRKPQHEQGKSLCHSASRTKNDRSRIFQRAARIIRQSTRADGVIFFDTSQAQGSIPSFHDATPTASSDEYSSTTAGSTTTHRKKRNAKGYTLTRTEDNAEPALGDSHPCPVVALTLRSAELGVTDEDFLFTEANMERYIARYPQGKFFNFDEQGLGINSSDEKSEKSETEQSDKTISSTTTVRKARKRKDRFIPTELLKVLPSVKSLIFLPLWDPTSERWTACSFIWTMANGRLMNSESEFPYLKAFGNTITSEIARWSAQRSDRAKTTFIASISHELRSPLHGILGSVEFLRDSVSSPYQQSLIGSIETCGKTLLDTIDHVLDYAKINKLRSANAKRKQKSGRRSRLPADNSILGVTTVFNLSQLVEEVCDTVCAGHQFRKTHDVNHSTFHDQGMRSRANSNASAEAGDANYSGIRSKDRVVVTLSVAPFVQWIVKSQPGALRRVVMNLLGNALKYTDAGFITVSLEHVRGKSNAQFVEFTIIVEDSGKGMSAEFQNTRLFAAFSQEDPFSNGTGLGLSIVKQIVESLRGEVSVESKPGVGTKISVAMKLPAGKAEDARTDQMLLEKPKALDGKSASLLLPDISLGSTGEKLRNAMLKACQNLNFDVSETFDSVKAPTFLITEPDTLMHKLRESKSKDPSQPPLVVVCVCTDAEEKTLTENHIREAFQFNGWVIEVVAQPCGPRRFTKLLLDGLERASQPVEHLEVRAQHGQSPPMAHTLSVSLMPTAHRSISDLGRGGNHVPSAVASAHSPLISATMPIGNEPPSTLGQIAATPNSEGQSEYFTPRVLLVDDNTINLKLLVVFARRQNFRYAEAVNGLQALEKYKSEAASTTPPSKPFDFILMDLSMPVMGGLESTRSIRQFEQEQNLSPSTIVALTGLASAQDQQEAFDSGIDTYLVKPVKFGDIKRIFGAK